MTTEPRDLVGKARVRIFSGATGSRSVMAEGDVIGYCAAPTLLLVHDDGTQSSWSTALPREVVGPFNPHAINRTKEAPMTNAQPGWLLALVAHAEQYEDFHSDPGVDWRCFRDLLAAVPDEVKAQAAGYAQAKTEMPATPAQAGDKDALARLHDVVAGALARVRTAENAAANDGRDGDALLNDARVDCYDWALQRIDEERAR